MIKLIGVATFVLALATSAHAVPRLPLHQPDGITLQVRQGCGVGRVRINGVCVTRRYGYGYGRPYYGYGYRPYRYGYYGSWYRPFGFYGARRAYWRGRAYRRWR
jgi:hypothetical protein